jgi:DNA-binding response OmpR family regulator
MVALRRKLGEHGNLIQTEHGVGFRFQATSTEAG